MRPSIREALEHCLAGEADFAAKRQQIIAQRFSPGFWSLEYAPEVASEGVAHGIDTLVRPIAATHTGSDRFGLASEAALHEKAACSRYFSEQAGKVNESVNKIDALRSWDRYLENS